MVVQQLVQERVPVRDLDALMRGFVPHAWGSTAAARIVAAIRLELAPQLPGISDGRERVALGEELEERMASWLLQRDGEYVVSLPRGEAQALSRALADRVGQSGAAAAIVIERPELRRPVWRLAHAVMPDVAAITAEELAAAG